MAAKKVTKKADDEGAAWTTFRLHAEDGEALRDLAKEEGKTIADLYRELFAATVKNRLIERTEARLKKMKGQ